MDLPLSCGEPSRSPDRDTAKLLAINQFHGTTGVFLGFHKDDGTRVPQKDFLGCGHLRDQSENVGTGRSARNVAEIEAAGDCRATAKNRRDKLNIFCCLQLN